MFAVHVKELDDIKTHYTDFVKILNDHDRIILNNNGKDEAVLINMEDYKEFELYAHKNYIINKLKETEDLAKDKNAGWLDEATFWENDK